MSTQTSLLAFKDWTHFCEKRADYLMALGETVEQSFLRKDTDHPVFCGCIDWHSSVHGAYALLTAARLTGRWRWAEIVDRVLQPGCLAEESASLNRGELNHELPYGFAWFLRLAREREQRWGRTELLPLAGKIAGLLKEWLLSLSDEAVLHHILRREYGNLSWALLNLWEWGQWRRDGALVEDLLGFTRDGLIPLDSLCPPSLMEENTDEFFSAELQRYRTLLTVLSAEDSGTWLAKHPSACDGLAPLTSFSTPHAAGLNFSRSWSLWTFFQRTQDTRYRDAYLGHVMTHLEMPHYWREDYRKHGHWVPQFGIYAIALSFDEQSASSGGGGLFGL